MPVSRPRTHAEILDDELAILEVARTLEGAFNVGIVWRTLQAEGRRMSRDTVQRFLRGLMLDGMLRSVEQPGAGHQSYYEWVAP